MAFFKWNKVVFKPMATFVGVLFILCCQPLYANDFGDVSIHQQHCLAEMTALPAVETLPIISVSDTHPSTDRHASEWLPPHTMVYPYQNDVLKHMTVTYYLDTVSKLGYVRVNGGIADITHWYGSFPLRDEIIDCLHAK